MVAERTGEIRDATFSPEHSKFFGHDIFTFPTNGKKGLVTVTTLEQASQLGLLIRDKFFHGSLDIPISWSQINWPNEWVQPDEQLWLLQAGYGIKHILQPRNGSVRSQALYTAEGFFEEGVFLEQIVNAFSVTSHHHHKVGQPEYYSGSGGLFIWKGRGEIVPVDKLTVIPAEATHVAFALNRSAITHIYNAGKGIEHIPESDQPPIEFLVEEARKVGLVSDEVWADFKKFQSTA